MQNMTGAPIPVEKALQPAFKWLAAAISSDPHRPICNLLNWNGEEFAATDGRCLHVFTPAPDGAFSEMEPGKFILDKAGKTLQRVATEDRYLLYRQVIPRNLGQAVEAACIHALNTRIQRVACVEHRFIKPFQGEKDRLLTLDTIPKAPSIWTVAPGTKNCQEQDTYPLVLKHTSRGCQFLAVLMPMRLE